MTMRRRPGAVGRVKRGGKAVADGRSSSGLASAELTTSPGSSRRCLPTGSSPARSGRTRGGYGCDRPNRSPRTDSAPERGNLPTP